MHGSTWFDTGKARPAGCVVMGSLALVVEPWALEGRAGLGEQRRGTKERPHVADAICVTQSTTNNTVAPVLPRVERGPRALTLNPYPWPFPLALTLNPYP